MKNYELVGWLQSLPTEDEVYMEIYFPKTHDYSEVNIKAVLLDMAGTTKECIILSGEVNG